MKNLLLILTIVSCNHRDSCFSDFEAFQNLDERPLISVVEEMNAADCEYRISLFFCSSTHIFNGEGRMKLNQDIIYIRALSPATKNFQMFNLRSSPGDEYKVEIKPELVGDFNDFSVRVTVDGKYDVLGNDIYVFRIHDFFCYNDELFDSVFFVTLKKGVVGSYVSKIYQDGKEFLILPRGNILEDIIDYSGMMKGSLK